jgi:hypothetical protein
MADAGVLRELEAFAIKYGRRPPRSTALGRQARNLMRRKNLDESMQQCVDSIFKLPSAHKSTLPKIFKAKKRILKTQTPARFATTSGRFQINQAHAERKRSKIASKRPAAAGISRKKLKRPAAATEVGWLAESASLLSPSTFALEAGQAKNPVRMLQVRGGISHRIGRFDLLSQSAADYLYLVLYDFRAFMKSEFEAVDWIVDFGTLLATVREKKGVIAYDQDVDVAIVLQSADFFEHVMAPKILLYMRSLGHRGHFLKSTVGLPALKVSQRGYVIVMICMV